MKRQTAFLLILLFSIVFLSSPPPKPLIPPCATVTQADVSSTGSPNVLMRRYREPEKIQKILNILRICLQDYSVSPLPLHPFGEDITIHIRLTNGEIHTYWIRSRRYLLTDSGIWKPIKEEQANSLLQIILSTHSDA